MQHRRSGSRSVPRSSISPYRNVPTSSSMDSLRARGEFARRDLKDAWSKGRDRQTSSDCEAHDLAGRAAAHRTLDRSLRKNHKLDQERKDDRSPEKTVNIRTARDLSTSAKRLSISACSCAPNRTKSDFEARSRAFATSAAAAFALSSGTSARSSASSISVLITPHRWAEHTCRELRCARPGLASDEWSSDGDFQNNQGCRL